ncbi:hypothetical protein RRG08_006841 [Elysia crispata]|uniref:Uncharacterized protein n=1 Tax=Elysia crispata TaxID=231223 RepID=A0AAE0XVM1_9GAST|nr:hypothetical protein RRG08_006841 [Elysia crispata]
MFRGEIKKKEKIGAQSKTPIIDNCLKTRHQRGLVNLGYQLRRESSHQDLVSSMLQSSISFEHSWLDNWLVRLQLQPND